MLLVDDHGLVRIGLREQLTSCQDFSVVGEAASVKKAVELARRLTPTIVLLDLNLPDGSGIQACRQILASAPDMRVLIMTICDDSAAVHAAMAAGAHGYVLKDVGPDMLLEAVRTVALGASFFHPRSLLTALSVSSEASDPEALNGLKSFHGKNGGSFRCWEKAGPIKKSALSWPSLKTPSRTICPICLGS